MGKKAQPASFFDVKAFRQTGHAWNEQALSAEAQDWHASAVI